MSGSTDLLRWWRDSTARDVGIALLMAVITVFGSYGEVHPSQVSDIRAFRHGLPHLPNAGLALVAVAALVLAWRRRYPLTVLAISAAAVTTYTLLGYVNGSALLSVVLALYTVAVLVRVRTAVAAAAVTLVALMASTAATNPFGAAGGGFFLIPGLVAAPLFGGIAVSNRRAYVASIQARADDEANRRIGEERLRIARELHDVVAHTMSTIHVQANAAAQVLTDRPEAAAQALQAIRTASKDGLRELRAILNVLRQADDTDPITPVPSLAHVDSLIGSAAQAGLPTTLRVTGEPSALPPTVDLAAYRIIQESLTNVIRHAGPATATVSLTYQSDELLVEVADTGRGAVRPGHYGTVHPGVVHHGAGSDGLGGDAARDGHPGHGLIGMRERASAIGGVLTAGPASDGGFVVAATLPLATESRYPDSDYPGPQQPEPQHPDAEHAGPQHAGPQHAEAQHREPPAAQTQPPTRSTSRKVSANDPGPARR